MSPCQLIIAFSRVANPIFHAGKGRGLLSTAQLTSGELLLVSRPLSIVYADELMEEPSTSDEQQQQEEEGEDELGGAMFTQLQQQLLDKRWGGVQRRELGSSGGIQNHLRCKKKLVYHQMHDAGCPHRAILTEEAAAVIIAALSPAATIAAAAAAVAGLTVGRCAVRRAGYVRSALYGFCHQVSMESSGQGHTEHSQGA